MKYLRLAIIFTCLLVCATGIISAKSKTSVKVFYVTGHAEYLSSGKSNWKTLKTGARLYSGDSIKTGEGVWLDIAFDESNKNMVSVRPQSHVVIRLEKCEKIELIDGEVFALVRNLPRGSTFEIRTPTAICGARGTGWGVSGNSGGTTVSAYQSDSYVKGLAKDGTPKPDETALMEGYKSVVKLFGSPSGLKKISEQEYLKWGKWLDDLMQRIYGRRIIMERLITDLEKIEDKQERIEERKDDDRIRKREERSISSGDYDPSRVETSSE